MEQELIISPNDKRQYSVLTLENKLQTLIISDPNTKISGACLEICVGMLDDPQEYEGLAHFCEHMLFMGSEKYPIQNDYGQFIQMHSGSYNASTSLQRTKYYFNIENDAFIEALDKFAQFFICPLFDPSCVEREMNAVESEFNLSLADDNSRMWEIFKEQSDPNSTFHRFGCGNLLTLNKPEIRDQLLIFYDKYYCSSLMKLVVYTQQDIPIIQQKVNDIFSLVPNKNRQKPLHLDNPFKKHSLQIDIVGIKQEDVLYLSFITPNLKEQYFNQTQNYIIHLLGHEGQNSLASFLKDEGLITELIAGSQEINDKNCEIYLQITLTEEGFENYEKVVGFVFQYIQVLQQKGVDKSIYDELSQIKQLEFKFKEKSTSVQDYIETLSQNMHNYKQEHFIYGDYAYEQFDPESINLILSFLNSTNLILFLRSQEFSEESSSSEFVTEPYCKTKYRKNEFSHEIQQAIKNCNNLKPEKTNKIIDIFPKNTYLPQTLDININEQIQKEDNYPEVILNDDFIKCYHLHDQQFKLCKSAIGIQLYPVQTFATNCKERVLFELWSSILYSQYEEQLYNAECAGISYNLDEAYNFFQFRIHGFNDSVEKLFNNFIDYIVQFHKNPKQFVKKHIFEVQFDDLQDRYENYFMKSPYDLNASYWKYIIYKNGKFSKEDLSKIEITYQEFLNFTKVFLSKLYIKLYIHGNVTKSQALNICLKTQESLKNISNINNEIQSLQIIKIPKHTTYKFEKLITENPEEPNSGIRISYQGEQSSDITIDLYYDILNSLISDTFENQLRTNEQLGYIVYTTKANRRGVHFFQFIIISETKSSKQLVERIDIFLSKFLNEDLQQLTNEQFESIKQSYYKDQSQDYQNMNEKFKDFWSEILINQNNFDRKQTLQNRINNITFEKFINFVKQLFEEQRRLEIHIVNEKHCDWELNHKNKIIDCDWHEDIFKN